MWRGTGALGRGSADAECAAKGHQGRCGRLGLPHAAADDECQAAERRLRCGAARTPVDADADAVNYFAAEKERHCTTIDYRRRRQAQDESRLMSASPSAARRRGRNSSAMAPLVLRS